MRAGRAYPVGMTSMRTPVGPLPPQVYWRRRIVVGVGILAVILIIVLIVVRPGSGTPADQPTPDPQTTETAGASEPVDEPAAGGDATACTSSQVVVTAVTDAESYPEGQQPQLSLTLLNTGTAPCTMQAGSDVQSYVITSGSDRIWASTDCQDPGVPAERILEPGEPVPSIPFSWGRTRSSPDDCETVRDPVIAGGATYRLSVSVGEFESTDDRPFILN